jgi:hypothetical protein
LLDSDRLVPAASKYAQYVLELLGKKGSGQVLNRSEIIQGAQGVEYMAPGKFRIETEWVVVLLGALVYSGDVVLAVPGKKFDATDVALLASQQVADLINFKHIERPKEWNLPILRAVFELLGLTPGMAQLVTQGKEEPVQELQKAVAHRVEKVVLAHQALEPGIPFWGRRLIDEDEARALRSKLDSTKSFLESLQAYTSPGKLKNFRYGRDDVTRAQPGLDALVQIENLQALVAELGSSTAYLSTAEAVLSPDDEWIKNLRVARDEVLSHARDEVGRSPGFRQKTQNQLNDLKKVFVKTYLTQHARARLGLKDDGKKSRLVQDPRLQKLRSLATIDLMPSQHLAELQNRLGGLKSCFALGEHELAASPECPHCHFRPGLEATAASAGERLAAIDGEPDRMLDDWTQTLLANLNDPTTKEQLSLLKSAERDLVQKFVKRRELPDDLDNDFLTAIREVLRGLSKVVVTAEGLRVALLSGGSPATLEEMKRRFDEYLEEKARGKDPSKVRIVIE